MGKIVKIRPTKNAVVIELIDGEVYFSIECIDEHVEEKLREMAKLCMRHLTKES